MSSFSQFGGGSIKSIQRGVITTASAQSSTATVSAVNTAKAVLTHLGASISVANESTHLTLTNATTITATRVSVNSGATQTAWQLVEDY